MNKLLTRLLAVVLLIAVSVPSLQAADNFQLAKVDDIVMYQVNPRVFAPQKSLRAVTARLDSIKALGVNLIWVMPIYPIGEVKTKNSPYSIKDYTAIAPEFGTVDDFKTLVKESHKRGMGVILDWVANHTAWDSKWMDEGHTDWYTQDADGNVIFPPNTDWTDVADLNYDNHEMRVAMLDAMRFWVNEVGLDGFRCDVADWVPTDFWKVAISRLRNDAAKQGRQIVMLAEGNSGETINGGGFDMNYGWDYRGQLNKVFQKGEPASSLIDADRKEYSVLDANKVKLRFTTNHDESTKETPVVDYGGLRGSMAAYVATVFIHGGALVYGSQEVAHPTPINFFMYVPVDWSSNPDIYKEYQQLIALINTNTALRHGGPSATFPNDNILAFEKSDANGTFLVLVNVRNKANSIAVPDQWKKAKTVNMMTGKQVNLGKQMKMKPYEYLILKKM